MATTREENIAFGKYEGRSDFYIFGKNPDIDTGGLEDLIQWGGLYNFQESASEFYATSTDSDDVGILCVALLLDENWDQVTVPFVLNGTTPVKLVAEDGRDLFIRGNILLNVDPNEVETVGDVHVGVNQNPSGGVQPTSDRVLFFSAEDQQSTQAVFSVPRNASVLLHSIVSTTNRTSSSGAATDIYLRTRNKGQGGFRRRFEVGMQTTGSSIIDYNLPLPIDLTGTRRLGTDIVLSAIASSNNTSTGGGFLIQIIEH